MNTNLTFQQCKAIQSNSYFSSHPQWAKTDPEATLTYFLNLYVEPLKDLLGDLRNEVLIDCGSGLGWFSFAFLHAGGTSAILVDRDIERIKASRQIAAALHFE